MPLLPHETLPLSLYFITSPLFPNQSTPLPSHVALQQPQYLLSPFPAPLDAMLDLTLFALLGLHEIPSQDMGTASVSAGKHFRQKLTFAWSCRGTMTPC